MNSLMLGSPAQKMRLVSGLVLFVFAGTHFLNTALGLISLDAMETARLWRTAVNRSWAGSAILIAALAVHVVLALGRIYQRRSFRLKRWEWMQLASGLAIPFFLFPHIVNTRLAWSAFGVNDTYAYELARLWPAAAVNQSLLLLLVWLHGCLGVHMWLRQEHWYLRWAPTLLSLAVLVPALALAGFAVQGRDIADSLQNPANVQALRAASHWPVGQADVALADWRELGRRIFYAVLAVVVAGMLGRLLGVRLTRRPITVQYMAGPTVHTPRGATILEISRANGIPHHSVCGGRARCSTCRVRIIKGLHDLSPPDETELATLRAIGADADVRLACQARPRAELTVLRLLAPQRGARPQRGDSYEAAGVERDFAVLFADIRGFTRMSEAKLPYDTVFVLNRVFNVMGQAIEQPGGRIEKYMGDGLLALFESPAGVGVAARNALLAAREIDLALDQLNRDLADELTEPLRIALGIHSGPLVVGRIGWGDSAAITVIGPTVNVASRIEAIAKQENVQLAFSGTLAVAAGADLQRGPVEIRAFDVKGVAEPVDVALLNRARDLVLLEPAGTDALDHKPASSSSPAGRAGDHVKNALPAGAAGKTGRYQGLRQLFRRASAGN